MKIIRTIVFLLYGWFIGTMFDLSISDISDYRIWIMVLFGVAIYAIGYFEGREAE